MKAWQTPEATTRRSQSSHAPGDEGSEKSLTCVVTVPAPVPPVGFKTMSTESRGQFIGSVKVFSADIEIIVVAILFLAIIS